MKRQWNTVQHQQFSNYPPPPALPHPPALRFAAHFLSYAFHPVFIPFYTICFLLLFEPRFFIGLPPMEKTLLPVRFFIMYAFFPVVTVLLAKGLGFLDSFYLKTQRDRIIPYMACIIFYFWMAYVLRNQPQFPREMGQLALGIFIASSLGLLFNIYMKISLHAISMGILLAFMGALAINQPANFTIYLSVAVLVAGLVCTARLIVSDHRPVEIYMGLLAGAFSMLAGIWADGILP
ncbi:MAG TPA: hypothetical protein PKC69_00715 [Chitinophagaceae bacterium]|nr:hypothetical protein [Chitinophagaceae bacterium]